MKKEFLLSTTLFGDLEFSSEEGFFKDVTINVGGREFSTTLYLWEDFISEENQKNVLAFLENIPMMYQNA